ncbi:MAG: hypothetical protein J6K78_00750 [Tidjanibacter sp.]|nr:hypothetical protein [Tidjanibacter sp.]
MAQSDVHEGEYPHHRDWLDVCDIYSGVGCMCCLFKNWAAKALEWDK